MENIEPHEVPLWGWSILALILFCQSTMLFIQARSKGRNQWIWGAVGLIQFPFPTLIFLLLSWKVWNK